MKIIIGGENLLGQLERMTYDGAIGIFYNDTLHALFAYLIFGIICILAIIGLITVAKLLLKRIIWGKKEKMTPGERWLKTGKFK